jgi:hypothetical protein
MMIPSSTGTRNMIRFKRISLKTYPQNIMVFYTNQKKKRDKKYSKS